MAWSVFWTAALLFTVSSASAFSYPCCDEEIIGRIMEYWAEHCRPDPLSAMEQAGTVFQKQGYDRYMIDNDIQCVLGDYSATLGQATFTYYFKNGSTPSVTLTVIRNEDGALYFPDANTKEYFLFAEDGVFPLYVCTINGEPGTPEGCINVATSRARDCATVAATQRAVELMKGVGVDMPVIYPDECACLDV